MSNKMVLRETVLSGCSFEQRGAVGEMRKGGMAMSRVCHTSILFETHIFMLREDAGVLCCAL